MRGKRRLVPPRSSLRDRPGWSILKLVVQPILFLPLFPQMYMRFHTGGSGSIPVAVRGKGRDIRVECQYGLLHDILQPTRYVFIMEIIESCIQTPGLARNCQQNRLWHVRVS